MCFQCYDGADDEPHGTPSTDATHGDRSDDEPSSSGTWRRRTLLKATGASAGAGAVLGLGVGSATAHHTQTAEADRFIESPYYSGRGGASIDWIVPHVLVTSYVGGIDTFQSNSRGVSAHYVVSNYDHTDYAPGHVTQMVHHEYAAHHARSPTNPRSIGIEHEWHRDYGRYITDECYHASARITAELVEAYDIPLNFYTTNTCIYDEPGGIVGHSNVPDGDCSSYYHGGRTCPYPDWDMDYYESLVREYVDDGGGGGSGGDRFEDGDIVRTTTDLNGREQPRLDASVVQVLPEGTTAEVVNGPETNDGITWWGLHVPDYGVWVWCSGNYLELDPASDHKFRDGDAIQMTTDLNGREGPGLGYTVVNTYPTGTTGEIVNGPETNDGYTWWGVHVPAYNDWVWCVEEYLAHA